MQTIRQIDEGEKDHQADEDERDSVGSRLRKKRAGRRMTLKALSEATGLSEGFISQLERDVHSGSVHTLQKLTKALGFTLGELFEESWNQNPSVRRFDAEGGFAFGVAGRKVRISPHSFGNIEVLLGLFEPGGSTGEEQYSHGASEETLIVLEGSGRAYIGEDQFELNRWDSVSYLSSTPHKIEATSSEGLKVLWAIAPPSY